MCEDRRTVEFFSKIAWISFIAFVAILIHVNKFRGYESYKQKGLNLGAKKHLLFQKEKLFDIAACWCPLPIVNM